MLAVKSVSWACLISLERFRKPRKREKEKVRRREGEGEEDEVAVPKISPRHRLEVENEEIGAGGR